MDLELESAPLLTSTAFSYTDSVDFSTGSESNRIDKVEPIFSNLRLDGILTIYRAHYLTDGPSNGQYGLVNDDSNTSSGNLGYLTCGTNGSSGGSLVLRNGAVNVESNTFDLSGLSQGFIHFWMREGQVAVLKILMHWSICILNTGHLIIHGIKYPQVIVINFKYMSLLFGMQIILP